MGWSARWRFGHQQACENTNEGIIDMLKRPYETLHVERIQKDLLGSIAYQKLASATSRTIKPRDLLSPADATHTARPRLFALGAAREAETISHPTGRRLLRQGGPMETRGMQHHAIAKDTIRRPLQLVTHLAIPSRQVPPHTKPRIEDSSFFSPAPITAALDFRPCFAVQKSLSLSRPVTVHTPLDSPNREASGTIQIQDPSQSSLVLS